MQTFSRYAGTQVVAAEPAYYIFIGIDNIILADNATDLAYSIKAAIFWDAQLASSQ